MSMSRRLNDLIATVSLLMLGACSGGSTTGAITPTPAPPLAPPLPPPPPPPPPASSPAVAIEIFNAPATQEFTTLTPGAAEDGLRIRYNAAAGTYDVLPGDMSVWQGLRPHPEYSSNPNIYFAFGPASRNEMSFFFTGASFRDTQQPYQYSNIAIWGDGVGAYWDDTNYTAFGMATPAAAIPVTGSASYSGKILGTTSYREADFLIGGTVAATMSGSISLAFNFQGGTLSGSIHPYLTGYPGPIDLGVFGFTNTVFSAGSTSFSGRFDTTAVGANSFNGVFAGPAAQEAMGRWNMPFVLPSDGQTYDAWGAFIAKK
jgi:hypothetical protein